MELTITGRHLEATAVLQNYAREKLSKLDRYYDRIQAVDVILDKTGEGLSAEVVVRAEHRNTFVAHETGSDLYACIDQVVDKLENQLTRHKERFRNRKHPTHRGAGDEWASRLETEEPPEEV